MFEPTWQTENFRLISGGTFIERQDKIEKKEHIGDPIRGVTRQTNDSGVARQVPLSLSPSLTHTHALSLSLSLLFFLQSFFSHMSKRLLENPAKQRHTLISQPRKLTTD